MPRSPKSSHWDPFPNGTILHKWAHRQKAPLSASTLPPSKRRKPPRGYSEKYGVATNRGKAIADQIKACHNKRKQQNRMVLQDGIARTVPPSFSHDQIVSCTTQMPLKRPRRSDTCSNDPQESARCPDRRPLFDVKRDGEAESHRRNILLGAIVGLRRGRTCDTLAQSALREKGFRCETSTTLGSFPMAAMTWLQEPSKTDVFIS